MRVRLKVFVAATLLVAGASALVRTEERASGGGAETSIRLVNADSTRADRADGIKQYEGSVLFTHRGASLAAAVARYDSRTGETLLYGGATFIDSLRALAADTLRYNDRTRESLATGHVEAMEGARTVRADTLRYFGNTRESLAIGHVEAVERDRSVRAGRIRFRQLQNLVEASGGVTVVDDSLAASLEGAGAVFNDSTGYGVVTGEPRLMKRDADGGIITITCADTIEVDRTARTVRLFRTVVMTKDSISATADHALYDENAETLTLLGEPVIRHASLDRRDEARAMLVTTSRVRGDTIMVDLKDRLITGARVMGNATSVTETTDSLSVLFDRSVIRSALIRLELDDRLIARVTAAGTARSWYYRSKYRNEDMFVNRADGDTLTFRFDHGELAGMNIVGYGGGPGTGEYFQYEPLTGGAPADSIAAPTGALSTDGPESGGRE